MHHVKISLTRRRQRSLDIARKSGARPKDAAADRGYAISWPQFRFVERR